MRATVFKTERTILQVHSVLYGMLSCTKWNTCAGISVNKQGSYTVMLKGYRNDCTVNRHNWRASTWVMKDCCIAELLGYHKAAKSNHYFCHVCLHETMWILLVWMSCTITLRNFTKIYQENSGVVIIGYLCYCGCHASYHAHWFCV
jgi:hypothetical protein